MPSMNGNVIKHLSMTCLLLLLVACGADKTRVVPASLSEYGGFANPSSLPIELQSVASSVVLIQMSGHYGTGFFVDATGLLITNDHVIGAGSCSSQGCYLNISQDFQQEATAKHQEVYGMLVAASAETDISAVQLFQLADDGSPSSKKFKSEHFARVRRQSPGDLISKKVYLIGHPSAGLKKWTSGDVFRQRGHWVYADYPSLPGSSGSPIVDETGQVIGVNHRGSVIRSEIQSDGLLDFGIFSASETIVTDPSETVKLTDIGASYEAEDLPYEVLKNSKKRSFNRRGDGSALTETLVLETLADLCDRELSNVNQRGDQNLVDFMKNCEESLEWLECRGDFQSPFQSCPNQEQRTAWAERFNEVHNTVVQAYGPQLTRFLTEGIPSTEADQVNGNLKKENLIRDFLEAEKPVLTLSLAIDILLQGSISITKYSGEDLIAKVKAYQNDIHYPFEGYRIFVTHFNLFLAGMLSRDELAQVTTELMSDGRITLGDKLQIESFAYRRGL